jgi:hypothetical protein
VPGFLAIIAGVIAFITEITGNTRLYELIFDTASVYLPPGTPEQTTMVFGWVLIILGFLAGLGGITVVAGGVLILMYRIGLGKFLIGTGIGMSLIGIIVKIVTAAIGGAVFAQVLGLVALILTLQGVAIVLSIIARQLTRRVE